jgi:hypothetical protein
VLIHAKFILSRHFSFGFGLAFALLGADERQLQ